MVETTLMISDDGPLKLPFFLGSQTKFATRPGLPRPKPREGQSGSIPQATNRVFNVGGQTICLLRRPLDSSMSLYARKPNFTPSDLQSKPSFGPVSIAQTTPSSTSHRHPPAHSLAAPVRPLRQSKPLERTALQSGRETPPARSIGPLRRRRRAHRWSSPRRSSPTATALLSATARRPVESWTTRRPNREPPSSPRLC